MLATDAKAPPPVADADDLFMRLSVPELNAYERRTRYAQKSRRLFRSWKGVGSENYLKPTAHLPFFLCSRVYRTDIENKKQELRIMVGYVTLFVF